MLDTLSFIQRIQSTFIWQLFAIIEVNQFSRHLQIIVIPTVGKICTRPSIAFVTNKRDTKEDIPKKHDNFGRMNWQEKCHIKFRPNAYFFQQNPGNVVIQNDNIHVGKGEKCAQCILYVWLSSQRTPGQICFSSWSFTIKRNIHSQQYLV